jgi:replication initiator protein RepSA
MADDEHPPLAHPRPLGIIELPCVEIVGGPASTFRSFPPPVAPPLHGPIVSGRDSGDTMSEARVFAQDPPELWPMKRRRSLAIQIDASTPARRDPARRPRRTRQPQTAPATAITATDLGVLARQAALAITLAVADPTANADDALRVLRFGSQTDAQPLHPSRSDITVDTVDVRRRPGRSVASYLAKYVTKSVAEFGIGIQRMSPLAIPTLDVSDHVRTILTTIVTLAGHRAYQGIDRWLHTVGYRGHITTKSQLFSTTMGALRAHRATWIREQQTDYAQRSTGAQHHSATPTIDAIAWEFSRVGLSTLGERALILSAAHRMIEHRHIARDSLRAHDPPPYRDWRHEHR